MKSPPKIVCYCTTPPAVCNISQIDNRTILTCPKCGKVESVPHGQTFYDGEGISHISPPIRDRFGAEINLMINNAMSNGVYTVIEHGVIKAKIELTNAESIKLSQSISKSIQDILADRNKPDYRKARGNAVLPTIAYPLACAIKQLLESEITCQTKSYI